MLLALKRAVFVFMFFFLDKRLDDLATESVESTSLTFQCVDQMLNKCFYYFRFSFIVYLHHQVLVRVSSNDRKTIPHHTDRSLWIFSSYFRCTRKYVYTELLLSHCSQSNRKNYYLTTGSKNVLVFSSDLYQTNFPFLPVPTFLLLPVIRWPSFLSADCVCVFSLSLRFR